MKMRAITHPNMSDLLSSLSCSNFAHEFIPLKKVKIIRLDIKEVIENHDKRVAKAYALWRKTAFVSLILFCFMGVSNAALTNKYDKMFKRYAILHGISPRWAKAVSISESALDPKAVSWVGARGLMQFMPGTWEWMAKGYLKDLGPMNPRAAIWVGSKYLRWNRDRVNTSTLPNAERLASAAYNSGWGNIRAARAACRTITHRLCDPLQWYNHVSTTLVTSEASQEETRTYVERIDRWKKRRIL